jgi:NAD(P)-dependent dehydrogenase (short-subunit alcohol dehydrogenase family)
MRALEGKVAIITGATSGIGAAAARRFVSEGALVVLGGRREALGAALVTELIEAGGQAVFLAMNVTRRADQEALVALALSRFGRLDAAFDNAGIEATGSLLEFDEAQWQAVFDTNVKGAFLSVAVQAPALAETKGSIVLTSSTGGSRGFPNAATYAASKHAVEGLMRSAALELAPLGVRVNVVAPGPTTTDMLSRFTGGNPEKLAARVPLGRAASAAEVADAAVWLASEGARFVTGVVLPVNGGLTA